MNNSPKLLILSGMHGDEYQVISCVKTFIQNNTVPSHVFIPEVSPSAVARQTRRNRFGHDVNRQFVDPPIDDEVRMVMETLLPFRFTLALNFHEDPDLAQTFYLYDSGQLTADQLLHLRSSIIELGAGLHTGTDDPMDADLGYHVEKGYISLHDILIPESIGFSGSWLAKHGITKRDIEIEIPGKATMELKQALVDRVFSFFLTPAFGF